VIDVRKSFGPLDQRLEVFGATSDASLLRDVDIYRATGGTLYYLRHPRIVEGGERVTLIVRDAVSGQTLSEKLLERNGDYTIDYVGGRIQLKAPVSSIVDARAAITNLASTQTPLGGNPVYLEVSYEYQGDGPGSGAAGLYVNEHVGAFAVGAGLVGELRNDTS